MTGPREWRHADGCMTLCKVPDCRYCPHCRCGLSAVRDAIAAGHRVVIGPDGVEGRLAKPQRPVAVVPLENSDD